MPAAKAAYAEGQALLAGRRNAEAAAKFQEATVLEPSFAAAWFHLAYTRRKAGQCDQAVVGYRRYSELRPGDPEPFYGLGLCLRDLGDKPAAVVALHRYLELERRPNAAKWMENARAVISSLEAPKGPPAAAATKPATKPIAADLLAEARVLRDSGRFEDALKKFKAAVAMDPGLMEARVSHGELLLKMRRDEEAVAVLRAAVAHKATYSFAWYQLAFALRETGKLAEAADAYQSYIKLRPTDPDPYYGLGKVLQKMGRRGEALNAFETYVSMEKRPAEQRWVSRATAEIATLRSSAAPAAVPAPAGPATPAGAPTTPPPQ